MFDVPYLANGRRALAVFRVPDDIRLLDLDNPDELSKRGVKPSQVVMRNLSFTQPLAMSVFNEKRSDGSQRYSGITWWSFHRPQWTNTMLWETATNRVPLELLRVEKLEFTSEAIREAAAILNQEMIEKNE